MTRRPKPGGSTRTSSLGVCARVGLRTGRLVALLCVLAVPSATPAQNAGGDSLAAYEEQIEAQEKQLEKLRSQIQDLRKRDQELKQEEVGTLKQLKILDKEVALTTELLRRLEAKQRRLEAQLEGVRAEHGRAAEILGERKARLARTLRAMYVRGSANAAEVLLRTRSLRDALTRFKYLGFMARNNERLLLEIRQQETYLARTSAQLTESLAEVSATATETESEKQHLDESRSVRKSTLRRVRQQRDEYQKSLQDLAASEREVQGLITALERKREAVLSDEGTPELQDVGFTRLRGRMPWPVVGKIKTRFGQHRHPKHATVTFNSGIEIAALEGELVRSVARGRVEYVSWLDGYGRTIIVNHGGGYYTVYAHLADVLVAERQSVAPGQAIAHVGDTGSLDGPMLHFEIRARAKPVDPLRWLAR
ncbi:MAG: murein hydrolase activator EnvC family protein [Candidatus Krumholzibacteriia bacterium]